jgi:formamidopyrimidine-DNA glycosylase
MNQKFVSGLGNIYVNEILFKSKVIPTKKIQLVKNNEILKIIKNTKKILKLAIKKGGSSIKDFRNSEGKLGKFQDKFKVYGRTGMKCMNIDCTGVVKKMILNNRSTFFCNICQK